MLQLFEEIDRMPRNLSLKVKAERRLIALKVRGRVGTAVLLRRAVAAASKRGVNLVSDLVAELQTKSTATTESLFLAEQLIPDAAVPLLIASLHMTKDKARWTNVACALAGCKRRRGFDALISELTNSEASWKRRAVAYALSNSGRSNHHVVVALLVAAKTDTDKVALKTTPQPFATTVAKALDAAPLKSAAIDTAKADDSWTTHVAESTTPPQSSSLLKGSTR